MKINNIRYYLLITRPLNSAITFFVVVVGAIICIDAEYSTIKIILAGISAAFTAGAGNIINDIIDKDADKINHPGRPIPSGNLSVKEALIEYLLLVIAACIISIYINYTALLVVILTSFLLFLYSNRLKRIPLFGNVTVAYMTGLAFIYGGIAVDNPRGAVIPAIFAFLINLARELVKDMQDMIGDTKAGVKTFPVQFGLNLTKHFISFFTILLITATVFPFVYRIYNIEFFVIVMVIVDPLLVYFLKLMYSSESSVTLNKMSKLLKLDMIFGLIAIYLGK